MMSDLFEQDAPRARAHGVLPRGRSARARGKEAVARNLVPIVTSSAVVFLVVVGKLTTPAFLTGDNVLLVIRNTSFVGIAAMGVAFVTVSGNYFSLSIEQTASLAGILFAALVGTRVGFAGALVGTFLVVAAVGLVQGLFVAAGSNPIVTTLAAGAAVLGVQQWATEGSVLNIDSGPSEWLGLGKVLGLPTQTWFFAIATTLAVALLSRTRLGQVMTLTGANVKAARAAGLNVAGATIAAFVLSSTAAGLSGVLIAAQSRIARADQLNGLNISAIAAVLIGGTAIGGGEASMVRVATGAVFVGLLENLMVIRGYGYGTQIMFQGIAVLLAVSVTALIRKRHL